MDTHTPYAHYSDEELITLGLNSAELTDLETELLNRFTDYVDGASVSEVVVDDYERQLSILEAEIDSLKEIIQRERERVES